MESLEVKCIGNTNRWAMIAITPSYIVTVFNKYDTWVITINPFADFFIIAFELKWFWIDIPRDSILTKPNMQTHTTISVITTEYPCITFAKTHNSTIEDTV